MPRRALFVLPVVLAAFIGWKAWRDLNSNARKYPEEFSKYQDKPDNRGRERRLVQVYNPKAKRTYVIDLNGMPTCDGLEPIPLANGSNPFLERAKRFFGPKLKFPDWLAAPAGATLEHEESPGEMVRSPEHAVNVVWRQYWSAQSVQEVEDHYRRVCGRANMKDQAQGWLGRPESDRTYTAKSADGDTTVRVSAGRSGLKTMFTVAFEIDRWGVFHDDPYAALPTLQVDRFDTGEQALYLADAETGQRFRLTKDVLESEDESQVGKVTVEPARFPNWFKRYPGAVVKDSSGAAVVNGVRQEGMDQEKAVTPDDFDRVLSFYQDIFKRQAVVLSGSTSGDDKTWERGRYATMHGKKPGEDARVFVSITRLRSGVEIMRASLAEPHAPGQPHNASSDRAAP